MEYSSAVYSRWKNSISHNNVKSICYDEKKNCLYIGTYLGGLSRYDLNTGRFYNYWKEESHSSDMPDEIVYHVKIWKDQIYISAHNGFFGWILRHRNSIGSTFLLHFMSISILMRKVICIWWVGKCFVYSCRTSRVYSLCSIGRRR